MGSQEMIPQEVSAIWDATPEPRSITCNMRTASRLEKKVKDKAQDQRQGLGRRRVHREGQRVKRIAL